MKVRKWKLSFVSCLVCYPICHRYSELHSDMRAELPSLVWPGTKRQPKREAVHRNLTPGKLPLKTLGSFLWSIWEYKVSKELKLKKKPKKHKRSQEVPPERLRPPVKPRRAIKYLIGPLEQLKSHTRDYRAQGLPWRICSWDSPTSLIWPSVWIHTPYSFYSNRDPDFFPSHLHPLSLIELGATGEAQCFRVWLT